MPAKRSTRSSIASRQGISRIAAALGEAEAATALGDHARALAIYEKLTADKTGRHEQILSQQAEAARAAGDRQKTAEALLRIYYEYPLSDCGRRRGGRARAVA